MSIISRRIDAPLTGLVTVTTTELVDATTFLVDATTFADEEPRYAAISRAGISGSAFAIGQFGNYGPSLPMPPAGAPSVISHRCPWCNTIQANTITKCPNCGGPQ